MNNNYYCNATVRLSMNIISTNKSHGLSYTALYIGTAPPTVYTSCNRIPLQFSLGHCGLLVGIKNMAAHKIEPGNSQIPLVYKEINHTCYVILLE